MRLFYVFFVISFSALGVLSAQVKGEAKEEFSFGPPLRDNILFAYTYTERVRSWFYDEKGALLDSSDRALTYFITQMQHPADIGGGAFDIEANIDSMRIDYRGMGGAIDFNTQNPDHVTDYSRIRHPAILVPSTLVSSVTHFIISPYGTLVDMKSPSFDNIRKQGEDPHLDNFTFKRIDQMINRDFLSTVFLPWRNLVPLGQTVPYDQELRVPFIGTLDRILFNDTAHVTLRHQEKDMKRPVLEFTASLSNPHSEWITYDGIENPMRLDDAEGTMHGELNLDQDGVVLSGFSTASGTAEGNVQGKEIRVRFDHEVFVELTGMTSAPIAN